MMVPGPEKHGVFKEQREGSAAGERSRQGPVQMDFHRQEQGTGFHCKCTWESTGGFKRD